MWSRSLVLVLAVGCYRPSVETDVPCSVDGACPTGQMCIAGRCILDGTSVADAPADSPDAATVDAATVDAVLADAHPDASPPDAGIDAMPRMITWKATTTATIPDVGATSVTVTAPACASGDVLVGTIAMGRTGSPQVATFTPPAGWTLVDRIDRNKDSSLLVYWHVAGSGEPLTYTWQFTPQIEGVAWVSCYANVDTATPIDAERGLVISTVGPSYAAPSITTTSANTMLVAAWVTHDNATPTTWTAPSNTTIRANLDNGTSRSGLGIDAPVAAIGPTGTHTATASVTQDYAIVDVLALKAAP